MFNVAGVACSSLCGTRTNFVLYSCLFFESDQFWSFFSFYREGRRLVKKLLLILFFCERSYQHFTVHGANVQKRIFFILERNSAPVTSSECSPVLLIGIAIILLVRLIRRDLCQLYNTFSLNNETSNFLFYLLCFVFGDDEA